MLVILIVALLFLGPDKMPGAAKQISKGIRQLKRGSREIQQTIENDETIGGAIRDLKSALRGEDPVPRKKKRPLNKPIEMEADEPPIEDDEPLPLAASAATNPHDPDGHEQLGLPIPAPKVKLPREAGEVDPDLREGEHDRAELAAMIRPASGTVAKTEAVTAEIVKPDPAAAKPDPAPAKTEAEPDKHG